MNLIDYTKYFTKVHQKYQGAVILAYGLDYHDLTDEHNKYDAYWLDIDEHGYDNTSIWTASELKDAMIDDFEHYCEFKVKKVIHSKCCKTRSEIDKLFREYSIKANDLNKKYKLGDYRSK